MSNIFAIHDQTIRDLSRRKIYDDKQQIFFLVCLHQVRCQHRRQYRLHRVSQLRRGHKEYNSVYFINVVTDSL